MLPKENIAIIPKIKTFTTEDLCNLITATADAIDNFDLDVANETLKHLSDYNLTDTQRPTLNEVKTFLITIMPIH